MALAFSHITPRSSVVPPRQTLGSTGQCGIYRERVSVKVPNEENARFRFRSCCHLHLPLRVLSMPRPRFHVHDAPPPLRTRQKVAEYYVELADRDRFLPWPQTLSNRRRSRFLRWQLHLPHQLPRIVPFFLFDSSIVII
ncbi:hypothetical protein V8G54_028977 [Vigna mungo]|uniref:Uncharacterized protein n=1 Tax=Vigna mungo TaxID=3915 RepID=A0AAQ3MTI5_VIGMU